MNINDLNKRSLMDKSVLNKKVSSLISLTPFFAIVFYLTMDFPVGFPEKSELRYSTGIFEIQKAQESANYVLLKNTDNNPHSQLFSCSYSPFSNGPASSCGGSKNLAPYINKEVTIGWYEVDDFLGFKNEMPQLVTIEMDGRVMRSYDHTASAVKNVRRDTIFVLLPLLFILACFFYWYEERCD